MTSESLWFWLIQLGIGSVLAVNVGRLLESLLAVMATRRWREHRLPLPPDSDYVVMGSILGTLIAAGSSVPLMIMLRPENPFRVALIVVGCAAIAYGGWVVSHLRSWWWLEPGCPLRSTLDPLLYKTGFRLRRVRLRDSNSPVPRVFLDGSLELSTRFISGTPPDEQAFLLAVSLHQRQQKLPWKHLLGWIAMFLAYLVLIVLEAEIVHWITGKVSNRHYSGNILLFAPLFVMFLRPRYSMPTLQFALLHTGDIEAAARAIQRLDKWHGEKQANKLRAWWAEQQIPPMVSNLPPIMHLPGQSQPQQQIIGRKP